MVDLFWTLLAVFTSLEGLSVAVVKLLQVDSTEIFLSSIPSVLFVSLEDILRANTFKLQLLLLNCFAVVKTLVTVVHISHSHEAVGVTGLMATQQLRPINYPTSIQARPTACLLEPLGI